MIEAYIKYKEAGLACLPTRDNKSPALKKGESWNGGWDSLTEYETSFGIGIICGKVSGNLECIDFDNHFGDAKEVATQFSKLEGVLEIINRYEIPMQSTMSGGFHLLYRCDLIEGNQKLASRPKTDNITGQVKNDVLIETRGEGGYFVASPTKGYKVIKFDITKVPYITGEDRAILLSACRSFNESVKVIIKPEEVKDTPGSYYNSDPSSVEEMIFTLKQCGWTEVNEGLWRRPGKDKGISATLGRAAENIFYNFSSSADPFETNKGYTAFQVVALLKFGGDFKAFAKELYVKYGLDKKAPEIKKKEATAKTIDQLDDILKKAYIDLEIPVEKPPVILKIKSKTGIGHSFNRVFTLGNFSAITGKSKSKKTFLTSIFLTTIMKGGEYQQLFFSDCPPAKDGVILFDTEQSPYDAYITAKRVWDLAGAKFGNFGAFDLREYSPIERCNIIERFMEKAGKNLSYVVIDGIADLATAINDELEATRVVSLLMKWTKMYNIHISVVIHQNKNDNYATGHLGSFILKKAECIISVTRDEDDTSRSEVNCDLIRGTMEFDKFSFRINERGLPDVEERNRIIEEDPFKGRI